jgi:hypothetical protein
MSPALDEAEVEAKSVAGVTEAPERGVPEPNFFLVGAAKSGSTSLVEYLRQHPDVFMPDGRDFLTKEPMHFCEPIPPWQAKYRDFNTYLSLFAEAGNRKAIGEGSVAYLASPGAETRIQARYPHAKIIIVLRNPADRVYSWYTFLCHLGLEPGPSLERALAEEDNRAADEALLRKSWMWYSALQYFRFGLYASDIERFLTVFPREQVHVLLSEDLKARPKETTQAVYEFLGVDPGFAPSFKIHNPTWMPFSVSLQHYLLLHTNANPVLEPGARGPVRPIDYLLRYMGILNSIVGKLRVRRFNPATRKELLTRYRDDIRRTEQLIGRSLDVWLQGAR